jgi:hypothetical protein
LSAVDACGSNAKVVIPKAALKLYLAERAAVVNVSMLAKLATRKKVDCAGHLRSCR